jgi:hypothetical protein
MSSACASASGIAAWNLGWVLWRACCILANCRLQASSALLRASDTTCEPCVGSTYESPTRWPASVRVLLPRARTWLVPSAHQQRWQRRCAAILVCEFSATA